MAIVNNTTTQAHDAQVIVGIQKHLLKDVYKRQLLADLDVSGRYERQVPIGGHVHVGGARSNALEPEAAGGVGVDPVFLALRVGQDDLCLLYTSRCV